MAKNEAKTQVTVTMVQDKVTKNAIRFQEQHANETDADLIGQLYVQKATFGGMGLKEAPKTIKVTVEVAG